MFDLKSALICVANSHVKLRLQAYIIQHTSLPRGNDVLPGKKILWHNLACDAISHLGSSIHPWMFDRWECRNGIRRPSSTQVQGRRQAGRQGAWRRPGRRCDQGRKQRAEADRRRLGATDLSRDDSRTMIRCDMHACMHKHTRMGPAGRPTLTPSPLPTWRLPALHLAPLVKP